jgi:S-DNA-T family DNA segregation ATPase FtsK/SpoIIIE
VTRLHQQSPAEPLIVILIDELATLAYVNGRAIRRRIENTLGLLLSQTARSARRSSAPSKTPARKPCLPATFSVASRAATCRVR